MYVCHCRRVDDRTIQTAIAAGAGSIEEVTRHCGAGARCGGCWPTLRDLLSRVADRDDASAFTAA